MAAEGADFQHVSVLLDETLEYFEPAPGQWLLDSTVGGGGHSAAIAARIPGGRIVGIDRDPEAIAAAGARLAPFAEVQTTLIHGSFGDMDALLQQIEGPNRYSFDMILLDLGISSRQLQGDRGMSFRHEAPLDMRHDRTDETVETAAEVLQTRSEAEIARIIFSLSDERWARRIAGRIVARREQGSPIRTTTELASAVEQAVPRAAWPRDIHVATRTFQALRVFVNGELDQLRRGLDAAFGRLKPGGRLAAVSFQSQEDRIVKQAFAAWAGRSPSPPGSSPAALLAQPQPAARAILLTRKPVVPSDVETAENPRSRSAKLRVLQRMDDN